MPKKLVKMWYMIILKIICYAFHYLPTIIKSDLTARIWIKFDKTQKQTWFVYSLVVTIEEILTIAIVLR